MTKATGIDVSHWQGEIDWSAALDAVDFAIIKATDGTSWVDPRLQENWVGVKDWVDELSYPIGFYHYWYENLNAATQAAHFVNTVRDVTGAVWPIMVIDVEHDGAVFNETASDRLQETIYRVTLEVGVPPLVYTSQFKWAQLMEIYYREPAWTTHVDLWVADYSQDPPRIPDGWIDYRIHQYTDKGSVPGVAGNVDRNRFRGTVAQLYAWLERRQRRMKRWT